MIYSNLIFPHLKNRPYFYSDFVSTIDGKVFVKKKGYWPIGSKLDNEVFTDLRASADAIIDGKNTALLFGGSAINTFHSSSFKKLRKKHGKIKPIEYIIITHHSDKKLHTSLKNRYNYMPTIFTEGLSKIVSYLNKQGHKAVFINGGPTLLASFLKEGLLDELFLTISPKIFGGSKESIMLIEGYLFPASRVPEWKLISSKVATDEVYLRYKIKKSSF